MFNSVRIIGMESVVNECQYSKVVLKLKTAMLYQSKHSCHSDL